jgi:hypothetical protein
MKRASPGRSRPADRVEESMADEYDFSKAVRGATAKRYARSSHVVILDPDVAAAFPNAASVNEALRLLVRLATATGAKRLPRRKLSSRKR